MDPALRELLRSAGPPEEELAVIVRLADPAVDPPQARVIARFGDVVTVRVTRREVEALWQDDSTRSVKASHAYAPEVVPDLTETDVGADEADLRPRPLGPAGAELTGAGVVIGALDWGLDIAHPDFRTADGRTRLLGLWDQRRSPGGRAEPYGYGRILEPAVIDAALRTPDPYAALGYHPAAFDSGNGAHGTHTFSIATGNGRGGGPAGYAPGAYGVFVNLGSGEGPLPVPLGSSVQVLEGLDFIARLADPYPLVVNMSLGRHAGAHKGRSLVERALDQFVYARPGRLIASSCGNYFRRDTHAAFQLAPGERRSITLEIDPEDRTPNTVDIWYPGRDRITVQVTNPDLDLDARVGPDRTATLTDRGADLARAYHRTGDPNTGDNQCSVLIEPTPRTRRWLITLHGDDVVDGRVHLWVERDTSCGTCQSVFGADQTDPRTTTGTIANGYRTVTVGAVDARRAGTPLARFSSSGPTRDARRKPDLVAPGVLVIGARSTPRGEAPGARYVRMSGTSMAAPAVTGTAALMFEQSGPLTIAQTRRALLSACDPLPEHDQQRVGTGLLNPAAALAAIGGSGAADAAEVIDAAEGVGCGCAHPTEAEAAEAIRVVEPPHPEEPRLRVAVVGGGLSGLMAARRLQAGGAQVTVFEAGDRLGGRVHTRRDLVPGKTVEAGAELIGSNHPIWNDLAPRFGLRLVPVTDEDTYEDHGMRVRWIFAGRTFGRAERRAIRLSLVAQLRRIGDEARDVDPRRPWAAARAAAWDELSVAARLRRRDLALDPIRLQYLELILGNDQCAPTDRQSYLGLLAAISAHRVGNDMLGYWRATETHRCAGGNDQLANRLLVGLTHVRLQAPVRVVELSADGVRVGFDRGQSCRAEEFDAVVLAGPPTTWPAVSSDAEPFRPEAYTIAHGPAVKHLNTYVRRFWEDSGLAPSVLSDRLGSVWESTDGQAGSEPTGFGMSVYSGGPYVRDAAGYQAGLAALYPGYRSQVRRSELADWPTQPWIRTGNSIPAPGQVTTVARRLSEPFRGRLFFAGEQASPGFFGYMEGALEAGVYAAERILAAAPALRSVRSAAPVRTLVPAGGGGGEADLFDHDPAEAAVPVCVPTPEPGPPGGAPHPVIRRGSKRPVVGYAQECLHVFLAEIQAATRTCSAPGAEPTAFVQKALGDLAARKQLPLVVDCNFGAGTEIAVKAVQACFGLKRDGIIGKDTWPVLDGFLAPKPPATATTYRILVDAGRNGSLVPGPERWTWGPGSSGAVVLVNNDDDDSDGKPDNENPAVETGDVTDLTPLVLELVGSADPTLTLEISVDTPAALRIVDKTAVGGTEIVGPARGPRHAFALPVPARIELGLEGIRYAGRGFAGEVVVTAKWTTGGITAEAKTTVRMAPWLVPNHLDPAEAVFVVKLPPPDDNAGFRAALGSFLTVAGCRLVEVGNPDRWIQDNMELGYASVPAKRLRTVLKNLRGRPLEPVARSLLAPDTGFTEQGALSVAFESSLDYGGNLECTPPVTVRGKRFPAGRIYLGSTAAQPFDAEVREFLEGQVVQRPIELDTTWLSVGHVDEVLSFVPAGDRKRFRMVVASPRRAYAILDRVAASSSTARMLIGRTLLGGPTGTVSVDQTVRDFLKRKANFHPDASPTTPAITLRAYNTLRQADIDKMRTKMISGLGLDPADVVDIPAVFFPNPDTPTTADALIAGMVNMLVVNGHAGVPMPFGPEVGGVDQFEKDVKDKLIPLGVKVTFLDCWDVYHVNQGEVHCGTNTLRTAPALNWWEFAP
jgi:monoamine oxidase/subtilisin family serine protease/peptidoglycan hydrolase-like protein with peptidoglycan-binding domain